MELKMKPLATPKDWQLRKQWELECIDKCFDENGNKTGAGSEECQRLEEMIDRLRWMPMVPFQKDGKMGVWDTINDRLIVPAEYDEFEALPQYDKDDFVDTDIICSIASSTPILARKGKHWGAISSDGENVILLPFEYQEIKYVESDCLRVKEFNKYGLIYIPFIKQRRLDFPSIADKIEYDNTVDCFIYYRKGKLGILGVTEAVYDGFSLFDDAEESIVAIKEGKSGFLSKSAEFFQMDSTFLPGNEKRLHHWDVTIGCFMDLKN